MSTPKLIQAMTELIAAVEDVASGPVKTQPSHPHELTEEQIRVLHALDEAAAASPEAPHRSFVTISAVTGLDQKAVRTCVRALARHGLAKFGRGKLNSDPHHHGSGYAITDLGRVQTRMVI